MISYKSELSLHSKVHKKIVVTEQVSHHDNGTFQLHNIFPFSRKIDNHVDRKHNLNCYIFSNLVTPSILGISVHCVFTGLERKSNLAR